MLIRFDRMYERDRQTDRHRTAAWAALMHSIAAKTVIAAVRYTCSRSGR